MSTISRFAAKRACAVHFYSDFCRHWEAQTECGGWQKVFVFSLSSCLSCCPLSLSLSLSLALVVRRGIDRAIPRLKNGFEIRYK